jgi:hypothetical protein
MTDEKRRLEEARAPNTSWRKWGPCLSERHWGDRARGLQRHGQRLGPVRGHLHAAPDFQRASARFLENHDEPRAAAVFPPPRRLRTSNHLRRRAEPGAMTSASSRFGKTSR